MGGPANTFLVRNEPDGDTAYVMIHDKAEDGESKIVELRITDIKARKYKFRGREYPDVDSIGDDLSAMSNSITASSGRQVYCKEAAERPGTKKINASTSGGAAAPDTT